MLQVELKEYVKMEDTILELAEKEEEPLHPVRKLPKASGNLFVRVLLQL